MIEIYYNRYKITVRLAIAGIILLFGLFYFLSFDFSEFDKTSYRSNILVAYYLGIIVLASLLMVIVNLFRLFSSKPKAVINSKGIFLNDYLSWGLIDWKEITDILKEKRKSIIAPCYEPCIVMKLSNGKSGKVFDTEALLKTSFLDCNEDELFDIIISYWKGTNNLHT